MVCAICGIRRPKRHCPGVAGEICSVCCGTEREITVSCPLDCEFLQDSRRHEKRDPFDPDHLPDRDIRVPEEFLRDHEELVVSLAGMVAEAALETPGAVDFDVRDALAALVSTYRTLQSGVYYETRPGNALADRIYRGVQERIEKFRAEERRRLGMPRTRDADILYSLVFWKRLEFERNNGRRRGRAFIDLVRTLVEAQEGSAERGDSLLVLP
ncbi:MAG: hypothetical protein JO336_13950 [Acidobacteriia bacterium]|nr:hypothetical protein [Terriglobia bacterium]MBV8904405.1 hypothetical protein [Terriglobia bacterium]